MEWRPPGPFQSPAPGGPLSWGTWKPPPGGHEWLQTQVGSFVFQTSSWELAIESRDWIAWPPLASPSLRSENRNIGIRRKITIGMMRHHRTTNCTQSVHDGTSMLSTSTLGLWAFPQQRKLKAARRKVRLTARGTASPSILFGKKEKKKFC